MTTAAIIFLIVGLTGAAFTKQRKLGSVITTLLFLLFLLSTLIYVIADNLTGQGFDESVIYHMQYGLGGAGLMDFLQLMVICLVLILASFLLSFFLYRLLKRNHLNWKYSAWLSLFPSVLIGVAILLHPLSRDLFDTFSTSKSSKFSALYQPPIVGEAPEKST